MGHLDGRTVIVTGAGRGIGREHALMFAAEGASVVVNDLGGAQDGSGAAAGPAQHVADEIIAAGGKAVANGDDVADSDGAKRIVATALDAFGRVDGLVNNAGILRDRVLVNIEDDDWDLVVRVNLRGSFLMTREVARYWRAQSKAGADVAGSVVNTSSESGVFGNPGQANYAAAKAAIASMTQVSSKELHRYGVRVNAILPQARTRLTEGAFGDALAAKEGEFDRMAPGNVSPFVGYLLTPSCPLTGEVFLVGGSRVQRIAPWHKDPEWKLMTERRWTLDELASAVADAGIPSGGNAWTANPGKASK
ncbi:Putative short-chain type dehydrogenase/reductase [Mycolicibacterium vanbaalenii]|uniref:Short-chain type dehydrogenase/reductase n=1 Tax=Mycolicibacterium vanbaalenii TaxID=110539 RepID=A0A5S9R7K8_MYCVN|nr:SDR family oxidoreductase [Mycolicibacterium vanbaalenii]CAA0129972.1 Putative short-chain type dehydrogenase/reductase [Mycolicibacterium vanbaalenii]